MTTDYTAPPAQGQQPSARASQSTQQGSPLTSNRCIMMYRSRKAAWAASRTWASLAPAGTTRGSTGGCRLARLRAWVRTLGSLNGSSQSLSGRVSSTIRLKGLHPDQAAGASVCIAASRQQEPALELLRGKVYLSTSVAQWKTLHTHASAEATAEAPM